ncbi:related to alpha-L-rhamnosidase A [Rhynchosporium graminicola]|uniref:Related to alpha-L-rhamnosidase A n=1 Tax=Rhynchosporium graminicola TaxID=2792576 RepID=A0A1E1LP15_9HELO|nr:related to alpha-L-rhamnosidase A [Rhynchosporium commune]
MKSETERRKHFLRHPTDRWSAVNAAGCWRNTACTGPKIAAFPGDWDKYNYAPSSRVVSPISYFAPAGGVSTHYPAAVSLNGNNNQLIFDFGKLVGGIVTVSYSATGAGNLGMAFTEAKNWTGEASDSSNGSFNPDGAVITTVSTTAGANFTMPDAKLRGGFRYMTLFTQTSSQVNVNIHDITVEIGFQPTWSNLRAYQGYFSCSDPLLNKIWYAGAYTLQTNAIPPKTGREFPILGSSWSNDYDLSLGTSGGTIYVDGSKRDRTVWPGDLAIAVPSILVSTGDWEGVANTLEVLYNDQTSAGELPFAGPGINIYGSDTYHMATLIGTYDYYLWTANQGWLNMMYPKYQRAMAFITAKIDSTGMLSVTGTNDWGRVSQGGHNTEANMLMYKVLTSASQLATWAGDSSSSGTWSNMAATLKTAVNKLNFDSAAGAFKDSDTDASVYPQDGNALALLYSIPPSNLMSSVSTALTKNWINIGSLAPELPNNLVGFGQSFEVKGHFTAHQTNRALDLIRRAWGWYLNSPYGTGSSCIEGYLSDGSFGYRSHYGYANDYSYTSHAHGWSTGPTDALTSYVVGLTITKPGGKEWSLMPQFGDLQNAEGGFTTPLGKFTAKWVLANGGYTLSWGAPAGTKGLVVLPGSAGKQPTSATVDGNERIMEARMVNNRNGAVRIVVEGGSHSLVVQY